MRREINTLLTLAITGAAIAGCTPAGSASPSVAASPSEASAATDPCPIAENGSYEFPAGDYRVETTDPDLTITLPAGFFANCGDGAFNLFGPDGAINIIAPVASVQLGGEQEPVEPTIEAVQTAVIGGAVEATDPVAVEIGGASGVEFVITVDENGVGLRSPAGRGWAFANDESDTGGFTLLDVGGTIVGIIRHGEDPLAVHDDVLESLTFSGG